MPVSPDVAIPSRHQAVCLWSNRSEGPWERRTPRQANRVYPRTAETFTTLAGSDYVVSRRYDACFRAITVVDVATPAGAVGTDGAEPKSWIMTHGDGNQANPPIASQALGVEVQELGRRPLNLHWYDKEGQHAKKCEL
jgi:hypothetical protein